MYLIAQPKAVLLLSALAVALVALAIASLTWFSGEVGAQGSDNSAPEFSGPFDFTVVEGNVAVGAVAATDPDGDAIVNYVKGRRNDDNQVIDDGGKFKLLTVNGVKTGEFEFREAPDYDDPTDANGDNVYEFEIRAVSGHGDRRLSTTANVTVTVVEPPPVPPSAAANLVLTATPGSLNVSATWDAAAGATSYDLWWGDLDDDHFPLPNRADVAGTAHTFTVSDYEEWDVGVRGCNEHGCGPWVWKSVDVPRPADTAPKFAANAFEFVIVEGNRQVGAVAATDDDGDAIADYVIGGADASLFRMATDGNGVETGGLLFATAPDHDAPADANGDNVYQLTLQAVSGEGDRERSTAVVTVTVTVVDAPDPLELTVTTVVDGLSIPWDLDWTPDGTMLFTERSGKINVLEPDGTQRRLTAQLSNLRVHAEGGLMALLVDPDFADNRRFYICQSVRVTRDDDSTVGRVHVTAWTVDEDYTAATRATPDPLVGDIPGGDAQRHHGCRLRIGPSGYLWIATGDAWLGSPPQDLDSLGGKILRVDRMTGAGAPGNHHGRVYSYGHRNPQGLALRPGTAEMWAVEHGPSRDDEINLIINGGNYGWDPEGRGGYVEGAAMTNLYDYPDAVEARWSSGDPTLATSGGIFLEGAQWGNWAGRMAVASLKNQSLHLFDPRSGTMWPVDDLQDTYGRLRTPMLGPDGALYVTTSNGGGGDKILRVAPVTAPSAPANLAVTATAGTLNLSATWDAVDGATSYNVRWRQSGGEFLSENAATATTTSHATTVSGYGDWEVAVQACNDDGCGAWAAQTVVVAAPPAALTNLAVITLAGSLNLSATWDAAEGATSYNVRWRQSGGEFLAENEATATTTSAAIAVSDFGDWEVEVKGCNDNGCGPGVSQTVAVTAPPAALTKPGRHRHGGQPESVGLLGRRGKGNVLQRALAAVRWGVPVGQRGHRNHHEPRRHGVGLRRLGSGSPGLQRRRLRTMGLANDLTYRNHGSRLPSGMRPHRPGEEPAGQRNRQGVRRDYRRGSGRGSNTGPLGQEYSVSAKWGLRRPDRPERTEPA